MIIVSGQHFFANIIFSATSKKKKKEVEKSTYTYTYVLTTYFKEF